MGQLMELISPTFNHTPKALWGQLLIVEPQAMGYATSDDPPSHMKVRIRNQEGKYLAGGPADLGFCDDSSKALVFDYFGNQVAEQLQIIRQTQGLALEVEEVDPKEILEICDACSRLVSPFSIAYDGKRFLCADCAAPGV